MAKPWKICAYFTKDTPYEGLVEGFRVSCLEHGVLHPHIEALPDKGTWKNNTGMKPSFILNCIDRFPEWNIIYVDIDAKIRAYPKWFDTVIADFAVHIRKGIELLSGTLYFANNSKARRLVQKWIDKQTENPLELDQQNLASVLEKYQDIIQVDLPRAYVQIFDLMACNGEPVIEHFQASRRFK